MDQFSIFCGDCGLLLQDTQEIQEHANTTSHKNLSLAFDGSLDFSCCSCDLTFRYQSQVKEHVDIKGHKSFINKQILDDLGPEHTSYMTPQKLRVEIGSEMRTIKKTPKLKTMQWSPIPFILTDDEVDEVFCESFDSKLHIDPSSIPVIQTSGSYDCLFKVRSLNNMQLGHSEIKRLKEKYVLAEGVSRMEALKMVQEALSNWHSEENTFKLISKGGAAYVFDECLKQVCLIRSRPYNCSTEKARRMYQLLLILEQILSEDIVLRIRSIYYMYPTIHAPDLKPKKQVDRISDTIGDICQMLETTRESLNLFASPQGLITGPLLLLSDGKIMVDCNLGGPSGCLIPSESVFINGIHATSKVDYVLVLEKDTVFHYLGDHGFQKRHNCILVTGRGQADISTRILLRKLKDSLLGLPFYCLVDGNPSGAHIFCTYRFGSEERAYDNLCLTVSDLEFLGLNLKDVDPANMTAMTKTDLTMVDNLLQKRYLDPVEKLRANLTQMKDNKLKADIEMIMGDQNLEDYILKQINEAKDARLLLDKKD